MFPAYLLAKPVSAPLTTPQLEKLDCQCYAIASAVKAFGAQTPNTFSNYYYTEIRVIFFGLEWTLGTICKWTYA